ncbi:MAPEG family protein [Sphingomonas sp.]|uniref:MAPEG family protein n=1 Tax=Sphingomonas sp. TaxID=28214 RepID=UPI002869FFA8|nr:MAPEG family protein [Sphingomonas sp.]
MDYSPLIAPVVVLVAWSLVMMAWLVVARLPAMKKAGIDLKTRVGGRGAQLDGVLPDESNWPGHNYVHLMEQPTIFYAIIFASILMGLDFPINVKLAWGYVIIRILHSIVQATFNRVIVRFTLFALSSLCLIGLTVHAAARIIHDCGWFNG